MPQDWFSSQGIAILDVPAVDYPSLITEKAKQYGIAPDLALAVARKESGMNPDARGALDEIGLFQLRPGTAADLGVDPTDPIQNIDGGVKYLKQLHDRYGGDTRKALMAYNGGPEHVDAGTPSAAARAYAASLVGDDEPDWFSAQGITTVDAAQTNDWFSQQGIATAPAPSTGLLTPGNIDLTKQPKVKNPETGGTSTVFSESHNFDGKEVLIPRVTPDGRFLTSEQAVEEYRKTGRHLGMFDTPEHATAYAQQLHDEYAAGKYRHPVMQAEVVAQSPATITEPPSRVPPAHYADISQQTGQPVTNVPLGKMPILDAPITGIPKMVRGAAELGRIQTEAETTGKISGTETAKAANDLIEGVFVTAQPLVAGAFVTQPIPITLGLIRAYLAQRIGEKGASLVTDSPEGQRLAGNLAALISGTATTREVALRSAAEVIDKAKETGRALSLTAKLSGSGYGTGDVPGARLAPYAESQGGARPLGMQAERAVPATAVEAPSTAPLERFESAPPELQAREVAVPGQETPPATTAKAETKFSSTQVQLPPTTAKKVTDLADAIPDADLAEKGREDDPHITIKYGIHTQDVDAVRRVLADQPPITVTLGKTSIFPNSESGNGDVLKADVDSPDLHRLNATIASQLETTDTHPEYVPHATIAYLKPGKGEQYAGRTDLEGQTATIREVTFSTPDGEKVVIPLTGTALPTAPEESKVGPASDVQNPPGTARGIVSPAEAGAQPPGVHPAGAQTDKERRTDLRRRGRERQREYAEAVANAPAEVIDRVIAKAKAQGFRGDEAPLRRELADRLQHIKDFDTEFEDSGHNPKALLQAIAGYGGLSIKNETALKGELKWLAQHGEGMQRGAAFGRIGGVNGVFNNAGLTADQMLEALRQEPRFSHLESLNDLQAAIRAAATSKAEGLAADRLEQGLGERWWESLPSKEAQEFEAELAALPETEGDISFNPDELETDVLDTGEVQARLPEAGAVREQNIQTPQFEAPFSLTGEAAQTKAVEPSLFGAETPTVVKSETVPAKKEGKGFTLQSTILPGAAEFGEYVLEPAVQKIAEAVTNERHLILGVLAPARVGVAPLAAGKIRAHTAANDQRKARVDRTLKAIKQKMDGWSQMQTLQFNDVMEGEQPLSVLSKEWQPVAQMFRQVLTDWRNVLIQHDLLDHYLTHYWPHEWVQESLEGKTLRKLFGRRPMQGPESFRKQRTIPTFRDGIAFGLEPASWNPAEQLQRKIFEMSQSVKGRDLHADLVRSGVYAYVSATSQKPKTIQHWQRVPEYALGTKYGPRAEGQNFGRVVAGHYYAPPEVVRLIENHLSPGLWGKSVTYDLYKAAGNLSTQLLLGWSTFHLWLTGLESVISKASTAMELASRGEPVAAAKKFAEVGPQGVIKDLIRGYRAVREFYSRDADANDATGIIGQIIQGGGGLGWSLFEHENAPAKFMTDVRQVLGAISRGDVGTVSKKAAPLAFHGAMAVFELPTMAIMNHWVPYLKVSAFLDMAEMELRRLGPADLDEQRKVLGDAWDAVDDRFGQLRYENLFWNNTFKQLMTGAFLSVGWQVGTLRHGLGALGQLPRLAQNIKALAAGGGKEPPGPPGIPMRKEWFGREGEPPTYRRSMQPWLQRNTAWLFSLSVIVGTLGAIYQYLLTGKQPESVKDLYYPRNGKIDANGREERDAPISYHKDYYSWRHHPVTTLEHKLKPFLSMLWEAVTNEDFYGDEIRNADDPIVTQIGDVIASWAKRSNPIAWSNATHRAGEDASVGEKLKAWAKIQAVPFTPANAEIERSDAENYLHGLYPPTHRTQEQARLAAARRQLRSDVENKTPGAVKKARQEGLSAASVRATLRSERLGSLRSSFERTTWPQAVKAYDLATPEERRQLRPMLAQKFGRMITTAGTPDARKAMIAERNRLMQLPTSPTIH